MRPDVHARAVPPEEEWLLGLAGAIHEVQRPCGNLLVHRLHAFDRQWPGVLDLAVGRTADHAARTELLLEFGIFWIVGMFGLLLGIQVIEVAVELVEPVSGRQHFVTVAQMVLAELTGHIALRFEQPSNGRVFLLHALGSAGQTDLGQAGAHRRLACNEGGASSRATLLTVPIRENCTFAGDAVNVGRLVTHHAHVVGADIKLADVVAPDYKDVRLLLRCCAVGSNAHRDDYRHHGKNDVGSFQASSCSLPFK